MNRTATYVLTIAVALVLICAVCVAVVFRDSDRATNPPPDPHADIQRVYRLGRGGLTGGVATVEALDQLTVGEPARVTARVCGDLSAACEPPAPSAAASSTVPGQSAPVPVGARIEVIAAGGDELTVTPVSGAVQPIFDRGDWAEWEWSITPNAPGSLTLTVRFRVLLADSGESLVPDTLIHVPVRAAPKPVNPFTRALDAATGFLGAVWAVLLAVFSVLGVTVAGLWRTLRRHWPRRPTTTGAAATTGAGADDRPAEVAGAGPGDPGAEPGDPGAGGTGAVPHGGPPGSPAGS
ncbi:hypothetical protein [Catenuloplanes indicus]|uniref:Uncharacterized protein n=1 Tax=Catenuloplanes indicus TaxID=137267 RepID=A0AAE3W991_9ACTN|nr:hypothetical protein [Catenuloplanes indicus]MDQ0370792.1 hypothetical protein [Catenuloplanes indicus]